MPIEKSSQQLSELVMSLSKSLYGDDKAKTEAKEMSDAIRAREREKKRYEEYLAAKSEWTRMHTTDFVTVLKMEVERQRIMEEKIERFKHMLSNKKRQVFLQEWYVVMKDNLQDRKALLAKAGLMEQKHFNSVMKIILRGWHEAAHGPYSRKGVLERHRKRLEETRIILEAKLKAKGEDIGLITKEMLIEEMRKNVVEQLEKQRAFHGVKKCYLALRIAVAQAAENARASVKHYKCTVMMKVFRPWKEWAYLNSQGLDRARWKGPRKVNVRYNQVAVDAFSDRRVKKFFFRLWVPVTARYAAAKRIRRRNFSNFVRRHVYAWQEVAKHQRGLVRGAVKEWKAYGRRLMESPFRMWFVWMDQRKRKRADQNRLVTAYTRTKHRKFLWNIIRGWRHQAVYGRIAGLYSRNDLMKSLTEQKQQCKMMEQEMNSYMGSVNQMNLLLEENTKKVKDTEELLRKKEEKARELRMAMHHCEQEMVKMQSLVDCVQQVHPAVAKHIEELQGGEFNFEFRGLHTLVDLRQKEENETGKETELGNIAAEDDEGALILAGSEDEEEEGGEKEPVAEGNEVKKVAFETSGYLESANGRLAWVLGRGDFRGVLQIGGVKLTAEEGEGGSESGGLDEQDIKVVNTHILANELVRMYGLFEFLRSGDTEALLEEDLAAWKTSGGGVIDEKKVKEVSSCESRSMSPVIVPRGGNLQSHLSK